MTELSRPTPLDTKRHDRAGFESGDLGGEQVGMLDELASQAELLRPVEHRLIEGCANELARARDRRARFERLGVTLGGKDPEIATE